MTSNELTWDELIEVVGPERAEVHRRKVAAMRAAGLHPDQVFGPGPSWVRDESNDEWPEGQST